MTFEPCTVKLHLKFNTTTLNYRNALFGLLEMITGLAFGVGGVYLLANQLDKGDLNKSILQVIFSFLIFGFIGISSVGYFHHKYTVAPTNFINGIIGCVLALLLGILISSVFHYPFAIAIITIFAGTVGFNLGLIKTGNKA